MSATLRETDQNMCHKLDHFTTQTVKNFSKRLLYSGNHILIINYVVQDSMISKHFLMLKILNKMERKSCPFGAVVKAFAEL